MNGVPAFTLCFLWRGSMTHIRSPTPRSLLCLNFSPAFPPALFISAQNITMEENYVRKLDDLFGGIAADLADSLRTHTIIGTRIQYGQFHTTVLQDTPSTLVSYSRFPPTLIPQAGLHFPVQAHQFLWLSSMADFRAAAIDWRRGLRPHHLSRKISRPRRFPGTKRRRIRFPPRPA